jgi:GTP-binding protein YchF
MVKVPDPRLAQIQKYIPTDRVIPATMSFVDIAGLVKGASKGEGLGNQFLGHIRECNAIAHVVRCFEDSNIIHVDGRIQPLSDIEVIDIELILSDLEVVTRKFNQVQKMARQGDKASAKVLGVLDKIKPALEEGRTVRSCKLSEEELETIYDYHLITAKKVMFIANLSESDMGNPEKNPHFLAVQNFAKSEGASVIPICGKIEAELIDLADEERSAFLAEYGLSEPGLNRVIRAGYELLGLQTYFTAGVQEVRAWTIQVGDKAPQAAGKIHTDFERGFIRAEVFHFDDLMKFKSESAIKDAGALRVEGKDYVVRDGDIMHFRFAT